MGLEKLKQFFLEQVFGHGGPQPGRVDAVGVAQPAAHFLELGFQLLVVEADGLCFCQGLEGQAAVQPFFRFSAGALGQVAHHIRGEEFLDVEPLLGHLGGGFLQQHVYLLADQAFRQFHLQFSHQCLEQRLLAIAALAPLGVLFQPFLQLLAQFRHGLAVTGLLGKGII